MISWYPLCRLARTSGRAGPRLRDQVHANPLARLVHRATAGSPAIAALVASVAHRRFVAENIRALAAYVPALEVLLTSRLRSVLCGGVILARGATDIDDPRSRLHGRSEIGPQTFGGYVTVDTGKYCTAPLIALQTADLVEGRL